MLRFPVCALNSDYTIGVRQQVDHVMGHTTTGIVTGKENKQ